jgi:excinuclease UvrABC ATPase subunit
MLDDMGANMASSSQHPANSHDRIRVQGARQNNLKDVSVEIPKRRLTVFTGVSGSGKSSLVFGTIAAESQRLINETYSAFLQGFMPTLARPEVDVLEGLTTAIIVDQERMGANSRSTVGTATDANAMLRVLFSRLGKPHIGSPNAFSFNVPSVRAVGSITVEKGAGKTEQRVFTLSGGMCPRCEGMGSVTDIDLSQLFDDRKSLNEGAITVPGYAASVRDLRGARAARVSLGPDRLRPRRRRHRRGHVPHAQAGAARLDGLPGAGLDASGRQGGDRGQPGRAERRDGPRSRRSRRRHRLARADHPRRLT